MTGSAETAERARAELERLLAERGRACKVFLPSFAQERLWFLDRLTPGNPAYHMPAVFRLEGTLDSELLERALRGVVARHAALRTTFPTVGGRPIQLVAPEVDLVLERGDLAGRDDGEHAVELERIVRERVRRPFDLARGPLLRAVLLRAMHAREETGEHVLLLDHHHLVSDAWSVAVLLRELGVLYEALRRGVQPELQEFPLQYPDFAQWQREETDGARLADDLAWWRAALADLDAPELPTDRPRPAIPSFSGGQVGVEVPRELMERVLALGRASGSTAHMTILAAFQALLARYSEREDVAVGVPTTGRDVLETEPLIGLFVDTLVMRAAPTARSSFRELLERVRDFALDAQAHRDLPFERLVAELGPGRDPAHNPLFQVAFVHQGERLAPLELPGLKLTLVDVDPGTSMFDLTLSVVEEQGAARATFEYASDLFDRRTVERMGRHLVALLRAVVDAPDAPLVEHELSDADERELLAEWSGAGRGGAPATCLHERFAEQARRTPGAVALAHAGGEVTYAELDRRVERAARALGARGVGPETRVGICGDRGPDLVAAMLAVLRAGGAYVPVDPRDPPARLAWVMRDAGVECVLTDPRHRGRLAGAAVPLLGLGGEPPEGSRPRTSGFPAVHPSNLAYVLYTSGSTGRPKGCLVEHRNVVHTIDAVIRGFGVGPGDRILQFASPAFDASTLEVFAALLSGATLCLAAPDEMLPGPRLHHVLREQRITFQFLTPSALAEIPPERLPELSTLLVGGEAVPDELAQRWAREHTIHNAYGPTEATIFATWDRPYAPGRIGSIGRPFPGTRVHVLDAHLRAVPPGLPGELVLGGAGVTRGYVGDGALTAARFVPDPFGTDPGARLYRTGDRVRFLSDGRLEFLGRLDDQIELRGHRIELGEIEAVIGRHPAVRAAAVVLRADTPTESRLVAYVTPRAAPPPRGEFDGEFDDELDEAELRRFTGRELPSYMVPAALVVLERMPESASGKLDRRALPAPSTRRIGGEDTNAPRSDWERRIAEVWCTALGVEQVGVYDNFFDLGGHSLLATRVIARIEEELGARLRPSDLMLQTLGQVAASLERRGHG